MNCKMLLKCVISALAASAMVALALLSGGCNKNPGKPSSDSILGTWYLEFYEEEMGGDCMIGYTFKENDAMEVHYSCGGEQGIMSMLWYTEGDRLYTLDFDDKEIYEEAGEEWPYVKFKVSDKTLDFYGENGEVVSFARIK